MIFGIGVDVVQIPRFEKLWDIYGQKLIQKMLTPLEIEDFLKAPSPPRFLATRFAAKEAGVKALGIGFSQGIYLKSLEILSSKTKKPYLYFRDNAKTYLDTQTPCDMMAKVDLSISDDFPTAIAWVCISLEGRK